MAFILTITMMFCGFGSTEAFAMELSEDINNSNQITSVAADSDFAYNTNLVYGTSKFVSMGESFRNKEDFAVLHLNNDLRTHRVLLKVSFQKLTVRRKNAKGIFLDPDNGEGNVKLALYVSVNGGTPKKFYHNEYEEQPWQIEIPNVPSGATVRVVAEAFTADNSTSNGNYRSILINYFEAYFD